MPVPILLVTGFLGAGKTTVVNHLLAHAEGRRIAAVVNDFGAINIDAELIAGASDGVVSLSNGCICCSLQGDLLRTLAAAQWIETDATGAKYRLGVRALICGTAYLDRDPAVPYATEVLEKLREQTGFTAHFARRNETEVVYLETRESRRSIHLISRVGRTLPAYATALGGRLPRRSLRIGPCARLLFREGRGTL